MDRKQLELNSLLEITTAINENTSEDALYKIFYFTTLTHIRFQKIGLIIFTGGRPECKVGHGFSVSEQLLNEVDNLVLPRKAQILPSEDRQEGLSEVEVVLPVHHKHKKLACLILGGLGEDHEQFDLKELNFIQTIANIIMVAIENKRLARLEMQRLALRKEIEIAQQVQGMLFPSSLPNNEKYSIHASYLPHSEVGGDYYDFIELNDDEFIICIADVSGKGVPAALLMSNFQASLRTMIKYTTDIKKIIHELNALIHNNAQGEKFITFFIGKYNAKTRELSYINAGHNHPLLIDNYEITLLDKGSVMLGPFETLPFVNEGIVTIKPNETLLLYTDGITETTNNNDVEFGEDRLEGIFKEGRAEKGIKLHEQIIVSVDLFKDDQNYSDDLTLLSCEFH